MRISEQGLLSLGFEERKEDSWFVEHVNYYEFIRWIPIIAWMHKNNLLNKNGSFVNYINNSLNENSLPVLPLITAPGAYKILKLWGAALIWGPALIRGNTVYITCWMKTILSLKKYMICLKELRNCVFGIICIWSLFCSVRVYISQPFLTNYCSGKTVLFLCFCNFSFFFLVFLFDVLDSMSRMSSQKT